MGNAGTGEADCGHVEHTVDVLDDMRRYGRLDPDREIYEPCPVDAS